MESIQPNTHSFVVKVWREETGTASSAVVWRGQITHVPSGEQRSIHELSEIGVFVTPYLQQLGAKPRWWWRLRLLLQGKGDKTRQKMRGQTRPRT
jgi:hypothetical protein